jgi:hypothetical protein
MGDQSRFDIKGSLGKSLAAVPIRGLQGKCSSCGNHTIGGGQGNECQNKNGALQRKTSIDSKHPEVPPIVHEVLSSSGQSLDKTTRDFFESRFEHNFSGIPVSSVSRPLSQRSLTIGAADVYEQEADRAADSIMRYDVPDNKAWSTNQQQTRRFDLSRVRVHTDARAAKSAQAVNAHAYTIGNDIVFGAGQFAAGIPQSQRLLAHELTHVIQQGSDTHTLQRKDDKKKADPKNKPATTNNDLIFKAIKKLNPEVAELITVASMDGKEPPAIKAGPVKDGEEHIWKVLILGLQGMAGSQISVGDVKKTKLPRHTRVTHYLELQWAKPFAVDKDLLKQASSEGEAFTLTAALGLYHELLHALIIMEKDPHWTQPHSMVFQGYADIIKIANSPAVTKERLELKQVIGEMAAGGGRAKNVANAQDEYYEFLVHEKYDANSTAAAFGKVYANSLIAKNYSKVVALRLGLGDAIFQPLKDKLAAAAEKLFDKLDQGSKPTTQAAPSGSQGAPQATPPADKTKDK